MHKTSILAIVPYEGLKEQLIALAAERTDIDLTAYVGDMEEGTNIARMMVGSHYDAILSRGATASRIKQIVSIPVIDITPSVLDVLRCIRLAQNYDGKYVIVSHANITNNIGRVFELLNRPITVHTLRDDMTSNEIARWIASLKRQGIDLVIGGMHTTSIARRIGMESILIPSGQESVLSAFDMASRIHQGIMAQTQQSQLYLRLLESNHIGTLVYSENGALKFSDLPDFPQECASVMQRVSKSVHTVFETGEVHIVRRAKNFNWHIDGLRADQNGEQVAAFAVRCKAPAFKQEEETVSYYHIEDEPMHPVLTDSLGAMQEVVRVAASYARTLSPVWIIGETGTPVEECAQYMHRSSLWAMHSLTFVDCARLSPRAFERMLDSENSPLNEVRVNICMKNIDRLTTEQQRAYIHYVESTLLARRNRIFYTSDRGLTGQSPLYEYCMQTGGLKLALPSLRERREDIVKLSSLYLAQINTELGCQVIGFDEKAEEVLRNFHWPGNNQQLIRVLRQLVLVVRDGLIDHDDLTQILKMEEHEAPASTRENSFLNGTLEEINSRIIMAVLAQEDMSRTRTIERLGISRSTLWRVLKRNGF